MIRDKFGVIINVSSGAGKVGFEDISAYCASKFGMMGLIESLALEVTNYGIRVMSVCPGEVATKIQQDVDPLYYELNKHKMLSPKTVGEKIVDMVFSYILTKEVLSRPYTFICKIFFSFLSLTGNIYNLLTNHI